MPAAPLLPGGGCPLGQGLALGSNTPTPPLLPWEGWARPCWERTWGEDWVVLCLACALWGQVHVWNPDGVSSEGFWSQGPPGEPCASRLPPRGPLPLWRGLRALEPGAGSVILVEHIKSDAPGAVPHACPPGPRQRPSLGMTL